MRMGVYEDVLRCSKSHKLVKDLPYISAFGGAGVEFSVAECAGAAFSVTVVGIRVQDAFRGEFGHIGLPSLYVLAAFQDYGLETSLEEFQGSEHSGGAGANNYHGSGVMHVMIWRNLVRNIFLSLPESLHPIAVKGVLAGVYASFHNDGPCNLIRLYAKSLGRRSPEVFLWDGASNLYGYLKLFHLLALKFSEMPCRCGRQHRPILAFQGAQASSRGSLPGREGRQGHSGPGSLPALCKGLRSRSRH